ncbi:hypothetical protein ACA910_011295 [Epithemia clementina (nom. ined.)]
MKIANRDLVFGLLTTLLLEAFPSTWANEAAASTDGGEQCGLYLAPSSTSTSSETVWGLFAGRNFKADEPIGNGALAVNLLNLRINAHGDADAGEEYQEFVNEIVSFLEGFLWVPEPAGAKFELVEGNAMTYIPGPGIISAMNAKMTNAQWDHFSAYHRPMVGELPGVAHPGRGAQSPFYNVGIKAVEDIKEGTEIFLNYGANYDESKETEELRKSDYEKLDATIAKMIEFFAKYEGELEEQAKLQIYGFLTRDVMNAAVGTTRQPLISKLLPSHPDNLQDILDAGGSITVDEQKVFRNVHWLENEGFCADNIRYGASTIKEAGRGAFATRKLEAGSTIVATPLIPIADGAILEMHPLAKDDESDAWVRESDEVIGSQLAINYCFGHPESSMVFLPAGPGVAYINHNKKPNAKVAWSNHPTMKNDWFQVEPGALMEGDLVLLMEIVALDTIEAGEEIFLDYGEEWAAAWDAHVEYWQEQYKERTWPAKAIEFNEMYLTAPLPTEQEGVQFPEDISLMAFIMIAESTAAGTLDDVKTWDTPEDGTVYDAVNLFEIFIVDRQEVENHLFNYTIRWVNVKEEATYVAKVPHDAFVFVDRPETSDHFVPYSFRHPIHIPDDVFPYGPWRNLREE